MACLGVRKQRGVRVSKFRGIPSPTKHTSAVIAHQLMNSERCSVMNTTVPASETSVSFKSFKSTVTAAEKEQRRIRAELPPHDVAHALEAFATCRHKIATQYKALVLIRPDDAAVRLPTVRL